MEKWVKALRSGQYKQGRELLKQTDDSNVTTYCCLGVACEIGLTKSKRSVDFSNKLVFNSFLAVKTQQKFAAMNDGEGETSPKTFKQIADYIEKNYKGL